MRSFIIPVLLIVGALGIFFGYINPTYQEIKTLRAESAQFDDALDRSRELQATRDELLSRFNTFSDTDLARLEELLPDNVDNIQLTLAMDNIAQQYNMQLQDVQVAAGADGTESETEQIGADDKPYGSAVLSFSVIAPYGNFKSFLRSVEDSLRLVDMTGLSFEASQQSDIYEYDVDIRTYWLK